MNLFTSLFGSKKHSKAKLDYHQEWMDCFLLISSPPPSDAGKAKWREGMIESLIHCLRAAASMDGKAEQAVLQCIRSIRRRALDELA